MRKTHQSDEWSALKTWTDARLALGRAGISQPTHAHLAFQLDHALARDAVWAPLDVQALGAALSSFPLPQFRVHSKAADRRQYLQRPDLGRQLNDDAVLILQSAAIKPNAAQPSAVRPNAAQPDLAIVLADGLSAKAVLQEAPRLVARLIDILQEQDQTLLLAPLIIVEQGRVAIADTIGQLLGARMTLMLIGERPGLSSPHSLGAYLTFAPAPGRSDAERNCVSNIRAGGLGTQEAAQRLAFLIRESFRLKLSGVVLKDTYGSAPIKPPL